MTAHASARAVFLSLLVAWMPVADGQIFRNFPDAIVCSMRALPGQAVGTEGGQLVFRIQARLDDGGALYSAVIGSSRTVVVSPAGRLNAENLADCDGKTIAVLRSAGRAFDAYTRSDHGERK